MNYIGRTSSLHFLTGTELHRNGKVHGGSMNHIGTTSSLHFLIRSKLHRNGEVHGGSMKHYLFPFMCLFPNSLQASGSNLFTPGVGPLNVTILAECTEVV